MSAIAAEIITCLCGQISQGVDVSASSLPSICHCSSCRAASGVLCTSYLALNVRPNIVDGLTEYAQSANVQRWFCAVCGAHVFAYGRDADTYYVATGLLHTAAISKYRKEISHWGIHQTRDGGLSRFLQANTAAPTNNTANGDGTACLLEGPTTASNDGQPKTDEEDSNHKDSDIHRLQARCHCGGVVFAVTRPDPVRSRSVSSPWPDLLVPYHTADEAQKSNPNDVKWWLRADDTKYLAGTCACTSCRRASGFAIQTWAFIPKSSLVNAGSGDQDTTSSTGFEYRGKGRASLQCFQSSPGVFREFCNACGATVFWHCEERPGVVDVSVGMLHAQSGARAEDWLDWARGRVSFAEDAHDDPLVVLLEEGLHASELI